MKLPGSRRGVAGSRRRLAAALLLAAGACGDAAPEARGPDPAMQGAMREETSMGMQQSASQALADLEAPEADVRRDAVFAIDADGDGVAALARVVRLDPDPEVRRAAVVQLGTGDGPAVVQGLVAALGDDDPEVIEEALDALTYLADERIVPDLLPLLQHPSEDVRERAAEALDTLRD